MVKRLIALGLLIAAPALAGTEAQDGQSTRQQLATPIMGGITRADTLVRTFTMTPDGYLRVAETAPAMDQSFVYENLINTVTSGAALSIGGADSNATPVDTRRMRLGTLYIKGWIAGTGTVDTTCIARVAIQIRSHLNNQVDSSSTYAFYPNGVSPSLVATAAAADTSQQGHTYSAVPLTAIHSSGGTVTAWSGEITVLISAKRSAHGNSIAVNGHTFYYPSGIAIPIANLYGSALYSPYTSIRARVLTVQKGAASLATGTVHLIVSLAGTPL